jgi:hypothetical protein
MDANVGLENLILARDQLSALGVRYFLMDGTLLGLVRDGRFIDSEGEDLDIGVLAEDFNVLSFGLFTSMMRRHGFVFHFPGIWGKNFISHWWRKNTQVDVYFYFRRGDQRFTRAFDVKSDQFVEFSYPAWMIETTSRVQFYGNMFTIPRHSEAVLTHQYGNWKVRQVEWDWTISPLNITFRATATRWQMLQSYLSRRMLGLSNRLMGRISELKRSMGGLKI